MLYREAVAAEDNLKFLLCLKEPRHGLIAKYDSRIFTHKCTTIIYREAVAAEDNLKFLLCLEEPCQGLVAAHPSAIPGLLPPILNCIRMVWNISRFYNTPERVTVLLRKLSNAIIVRCAAVISLEHVFSGEVRCSHVCLCVKIGVLQCVCVCETV